MWGKFLHFLSKSMWCGGDRCVCVCVCVSPASFLHRCAYWQGRGVGKFYIFVSESMSVCGGDRCVCVCVSPAPFLHSVCVLAR